MKQHAPRLSLSKLNPQSSNAVPLSASNGVHDDMTITTSPGDSATSPPIVNGTVADDTPATRVGSPKKHRPRPTSLGLGAAGEWLQRGVKTLGFGGISLGKRATTVGSGCAPGRSVQPEDITRLDAAMSPQDVQVPQLLQEGTWMTKVSGKKQKKMFLRLDPDIGHIVWHSKQPRIIPIENIKEIRSGPSTRLHRHHFQLAQQYENLWLTLIYILDGHYKILHLIAPSEDIFRMWDTTLRRLYAYRMQLMTGLGNIEERQRVWEKQYWKGADMDKDQRLTFEEVEKLCRRLNINSPREDLVGWFQQADLQHRGYLDFEDFRRFVKLLKTRKDIMNLFNKLKGSSEFFDFDIFARFMRHDQKSLLPMPALLTLFEKYSVPISLASTSSPPMTPHPTKDNPFDFRAPLSHPQRKLTPETFTTFLLSADNSPFASPSHTSVPPKSIDSTASPISSTPSTPAASTTPASSLATMKHDMTHPLPSYFISSSHNTYLVGHQLVGSSTVEGYIRALLAGCRSVEIDIYDGSGASELSPSLELDVSSPGLGSPTVNSDATEPMVFHGHTLTSKVPLRQICQAIMKYGFIASPYPIIISAENHCSLAGQDQIAKIMIEEFGSALVRYPHDGPDSEGKITQLPSPEDLKGRILFKTKNLLLKSGTDTRQDLGVTSSGSDLDLNEPSSSASESDGGIGGWLYRRDSDRKKNDGSSDMVRERLFNASNMIQRVRSVGRSVAPSGLSISRSKSGSSTHASAAASTSNITQSPLVASPQSLSPPLPPTPSLQAMASKPIPIQKTSNGPPPSSYFSSSVPSSYSLTPSPKFPSTIHESSTVSSTSLSLSHPSSTPIPQQASSSSWTAPSVLPSSLMRRKSSSNRGITSQKSLKPKMSAALLALLVYTVGIKCRGFRKSSHLYLHADENGSVSDSKSTKSAKKGKSNSNLNNEGDLEDDEDLYAPEHMFSLSENNANKMLRTCMMDLIRHAAGHLVRVYPRGTRMRSTNFEPHRYWSAGAQLVAINWQTFDLGYVINHAMFQRNVRCGYVLKPPPLRNPLKDEFRPDHWRKKSHTLTVTIISAQQLPRIKVKDGSGHEVLGVDKDTANEDGKGEKEKERDGGGGKNNVDPYVEVSLHVPEWTYCISPGLPSHTSTPIPTADASTTTTPPLQQQQQLPELPLRFATSKPKVHTIRTPAVKNNGFNPIWNHTLKITFDCISQPGMMELIFVRFIVKNDGGGNGSATTMTATKTATTVSGSGAYKDDSVEPLALCCVSLGELQQGYRHLPLYDAMLSQYLFSTLFVKVGVN